MVRWLVIFKSHAEGLADVHFVDVRARSGLAAIVGAKRSRPPLGPWALAIAAPWPAECASINEAALAFAG